MPEPGRGRFITVEGTDGAGKSTQQAAIGDHLRTRGITVVLTREPGGTPMGEAVRSLLLNRDDLRATPATECLLVFAARAQHIAEVIEPALVRGDWVVCDRFTDATYAYQGEAGGLGFDAVAEIEQWVQESLRPDLTLLFDLPVDVGLVRSGIRGGDGDRFERLDLDKKERIRGAYLRLAELNRERIRVIDAVQDIEAVRKSVLAILDERLDAWGVK